MNIEKTLFQISKANDQELNNIIDAVVDRHAELYPQWDLTFLALPHNDPQACVERLQAIATFIQNHFS